MAVKKASRRSGSKKAEEAKPPKASPAAASRATPLTATAKKVKKPSLPRDPGRLLGIRLELYAYLMWAYGQPGPTKAEHGPALVEARPFLSSEFTLDQVRSLMVQVENQYTRTLSLGLDWGDD